MTIPFTGTGGLFTRIGAMGQVLADQGTYQGTTLPTDVEAIISQYPNNNDMAMIDGIEGQLTSAQTSAGSLGSFLTQAAANTANAMVYQDNPLQTNTNTTASLTEIIRQMKLGGQTVKKCTVAATPTAGAGNQGNGVCVASVYRADGLVQENAFAETIRVGVTTDSTSSSSTAGREQFQAAGTMGYPALDWRYVTGGSGATAFLQAINGGASNSSGNLLTNSDFETFTSNVPTGWSVLAGTAGTQIKQSTSQYYTGSSSLNFVGDGSTLTALAQTFGTGTPATLGSLAQYAVNLWLKVDVVPAAGVLEVALVDGTNTIVNDQQGAANSFTVALTGATTSWVAHSGVFRTPYVLPSTLKLRIRLSTALSAGTNLYLDRGATGTMTQVYQGGPSLAVFSGSSNFYVPDYFTVAVTNDRGGSSNGKTFQTVCDRLYGMRSLNLLLPSASSPTISDALIT